MRHSKLTADEIFDAEKAVDDRKHTRTSGFSMAEQRDQGAHRLDNGVLIRWQVSTPLAEGEARQRVPDDHFVLNINGKDTLFNGEEFRKYLRWV